jgi:molecular chaperone DnaK (HSP70)
MPTIGRIISSLTGVVPQKTVDPDEAVALGCAVHVGVLDGNNEMGVVLNPMQAAILRAIVEKERRDGKLEDVSFDEGDEDEFENVEIF